MISGLSCREKDKTNNIIELTIETREIQLCHFDGIDSRTSSRLIDDLVIDYLSGRGTVTNISTNRTSRERRRNETLEKIPRFSIWRTLDRYLEPRIHLHTANGYKWAEIIWYNRSALKKTRNARKPRKIGAGVTRDDSECSQWRYKWNVQSLYMYIDNCSLKIFITDDWSSYLCVYCKGTEKSQKSDRSSDSDGFTPTRNRSCIA